MMRFLRTSLLSTAAAMAAPSVGSLARRARALTTAWEDSASAGYAFDSSFARDGDRRGWSNWLVPGRLMVGQYPHEQPSPTGPGRADAMRHLRALVDAGVDCFACLQDELPAQEDEAAWPAEGVRLVGEAGARWPEPFARYKPDADAAALEAAAGELQYLHCPIVDLSVPRDFDALLALLDAFLAHYERGGGAIYAHCWGGRGRAGLVGACMLSLLRPELSAEAVLETVQAAYDSRAGAAGMPPELRRSPQTPAQKRFVATFCSSARAAARYDNDVGMAGAGMPKGFL